MELTLVGKEHVIVRISAKLGKKIDLSPDRILPADPNPFADWSAHLFTAERTQYILISNTASLYSMVMFGRGMTDDCLFLDRITSYMGEFLRADDHEFIFERLIIPWLDRVSFSKALNRSVIGSMNDLVFQAKLHLIEGVMSPFDVSFRLNEVPLSCLEHITPRASFQHLVVQGTEMSKLPKPCHRGRHIL